MYKRGDTVSLTRGRKAFRVNVIEYVSWTTGVNWSILGYMSRGEIVPEVMTTLLNRSNTGLIAMAGSRQVKWNIGFGTVALSVSKGSRMSRKPVYREDVVMILRNRWQYLSHKLKLALQTKLLSAKKNTHRDVGVLMS